MSDQVIIAIVAGLVLVILGITGLYFIKDRIGSGSIKATKKGISADFKAEQAPRTSTSGNVIKGDRNMIASKGGAQVDKNQVEGSDNKVNGSR